MARRGVAQSGRAPAWGVGGRRFESDHPDQIEHEKGRLDRKIGRVVNTSIETSVNNSFDLAASPRLRDVLNSFIYSSVHKSPKTIKTLHETLDPFVDYLHRHDIDNHLAVKRQHVEGFILEISQGRRGKPLSPASVFAFTKDVRAFINYVAGEWSPEEWPNPVRRIKCKRPQVFIRPLTREQLVRLFELAQDTAPSRIIASRNRAMLLTLIDGALRAGELISARKDDLSVDGSLVVHGKGAKTRQVALSKVTVAAINDYLARRSGSSDHLFVNDSGSRLGYEAIKSLFHRWKKADPQYFNNIRLSAHTLRHTSATMRRLAGMSEGDLQTYLGHATSAMTRHYSEAALARSANIVAKQTSPVVGL